MVYCHFPQQLTEEEEMLKKKYEKLKRKKKALQQLKAPKPEPAPVSLQLQHKSSSEAKYDAKEVAKKLFRSGAISAIKVENKERQGFKRPKAQERRRSGTEKVNINGYQPFSSMHPPEEEETEQRSSSPSRPPKKSHYDNFVSAREFDDREMEREGRPEKSVRVGNTVYINGAGITEEILREGFSSIGNILNISMEMDKNCGFITFDKVDSADRAIKEMNSSSVSGVMVHVSLARRQPPVPTPQEGTPVSNHTWSTIAARSTSTGTHNDKRALVKYDDDLF